MLSIVRNTTVTLLPTVDQLDVNIFHSAILQIKVFTLYEIHFNEIELNKHFLLLVEPWSGLFAFL